MEVIPEQDRPQLFDLLFQSIDYFRTEVKKIENGEPLSKNIDSFLAAINMFIDKIQKDKTDGQEQPAASGAEGETSGQSVAADPAYRFTLRVYLDEGCGMENLRAFMAVNDVKEQCQDFTF